MEIEFRGVSVWDRWKCGSTKWVAMCWGGKCGSGICGTEWLLKAIIYKIGNRRNDVIRCNTGILRTVVLLVVVFS